MVMIHFYNYKIDAIGAVTIEITRNRNNKILKSINYIVETFSFH